MKKRIIVDTSIWIDYFKNDSETAAIIDKGLDADEIYFIGPVVAELLQGVRTKREQETIAKLIGGVPFLDCEMKDWADAGCISSSLRKSGITIPLIDLIIYSVAQNNNAMIFTNDKHFNLIPGIRLFQRKAD
jgi:predicted nucleic acid-binding protein